MDLLVPPYEVRDPFLDANLGPVVELTLRPPQVGGRQPDVPRLVGVPLDPHATPQGPSDQLDQPVQPHARAAADVERFGPSARARTSGPRSEEHTSELQSRSDLVCRLLLEKKKQTSHRKNTNRKHDPKTYAATPRTVEDSLNLDINRHDTALLAAYLTEGVQLYVPSPPPAC